MPEVTESAIIDETTTVEAAARWRHPTCGLLALKTLGADVVTAAGARLLDEALPQTAV